MKKRKNQREMEELIEYLRKLPRARTWILNPVRFTEMKMCYHALESIALEHRADLTWEVCPEEGYGAIRMEADEFVYDLREDAAQVVSYADNVEIYPLKNGKLRAALMFYAVTKPVGR